MNKCKDIIWKTLKFLNICINNFFVSCGFLLISVLIYPNYVKPEDINITIILEIFAMVSVIYVVFYICRKMFDNEHLKISIDPHTQHIDLKNYELEKNLKEKTCIHEAGHAVIAVLLGVEIESVDINKTITKAICSPLSAEEYLRKMIIISYAGPATEKILLNRISMGCIGDDGADFNLAEKQIKDLLLISKDYPGYVTCGEQFNEKVNATSTELFNKAEKMVNENKDIINTVADELLKKDILSGNEVKQIIKNFKE